MTVAVITIDQPSLGLNSHHDHHVHVRIWNTGDVSAAKSAAKIAEWIRTIASRAPGGHLQNVVFSCHGFPGSIGIGAGIRREHIPLFRRLVVNDRPMVSKFWLRCCQVALIVAAADGDVFCSDYAKATKAYVGASTELQWSSSRALPFGKLDGFEGLVLSLRTKGQSHMVGALNRRWFHPRNQRRKVSGPGLTGRIARLAETRAPCQTGRCGLSAENEGSAPWPLPTICVAASG